jgi:hypothetical protein
MKCGLKSRNLPAPIAIGVNLLGLLSTGYGQFKQIKTPFYTGLIIVLFAMLSAQNAAGQCCSAGNPVGGDGSNDGLNEKALRFYVSYKYSLSEDYYHYDAKYDVPYVQKSDFDYGSISLTYGLLPRLTVHVEQGYFWSKAQELTINNQYEKIQSKGFGDLALNLRYIAVKTVKPISQLVFSAGFKAPVGAFNEEIDGVTVPISLQPSSGAFKYNASAFYFRKRSDRKSGWNTFALFELSQTINKGYLVYRYGNYFQYALAGTYAFNKKFSVIASAKFEWRGKDEREDEIVIESSGSRVVYFNPQIMYSFSPKWSLILMSDLPVYKYVNGFQLTNKFSVQVGIRKDVKL